jgi:hypothetical protein
MVFTCTLVLRSRRNDGALLRWYSTNFSDLVPPEAILALAIRGPPPHCLLEFLRPAFASPEAAFTFLSKAFFTTV